MNIFKLNWSENKNIFLFSFIISSLGLLLILLNNKIEEACYYTGCMHSFSLLFFFSFLFFSFLFFSFLFLFQKNKDKFNKWREFSLWYLIVYFIVVTIFPWYIGDGFMHFQKSEAVFFLTGVHFIVSSFYLLKNSEN